MRKKLSAKNTKNPNDKRRGIASSKMSKEIKKQAPLLSGLGENEKSKLRKFKDGNELESQEKNAGRKKGKVKRTLIGTFFAIFGQMMFHLYGYLEKKLFSSDTSSYLQGYVKEFVLFLAWFSTWEGFGFLFLDKIKDKINKKG
jgi:hypothetical protein